MMKILKALFLVLLFATNSWATTTYYYLRVAGAGANSGGGGAWSTVPTSDANAMSLNQFNASANWSASDNASLLDDDDVVYLKEKLTSSLTTLTPVGGITLDGYEAGNYTASNGYSGSYPEGGVTNGVISIEVDGVTIQDTSIVTTIGRRVSVGRTSKVSNFKLLRNYIYNNNWVAVYCGFICDSEIAYNYGHCNLIPYYESGSSQWMNMAGGSRNLIHDNIVNGGTVGILLMSSLDYDGNQGDIDIPSSGSYTYDPDFSFRENEIYNNQIIERAEEGISMDVNSAAACTTYVDRDTVASVSGYAVTLNNSGGEWTGEGDVWSGMYLICNEHDVDKYGVYGLIESQSDNVFTLDTDLSAILEAGDNITIGTITLNNHIHHNIIGQEGAGYLHGFRPSSILMFGNAIDNIIEDNLCYLAAGDEPYGVKLSAISNYRVSNHSITGLTGSGVAGGNIVRNNTGPWGLWTYGWGVNTGSGGSYWVRAINNAFYGNSTKAGYGLALYRAWAYPGEQYVWYNYDSTLLTSDPTDDSWLTGSPPTDTTAPELINIEASGTEVVFHFDEIVEDDGYSDSCSMTCESFSGAETLSLISSWANTAQVLQSTSEVVDGETCTVTCTGGFDDASGNDYAGDTNFSVDTGDEPTEPTEPDVTDGASVQLGSGASMIIGD